MSLINTRIQNLREKGNLDKNELRPGRYGALDLFMVQDKQPGSILTPALREKAKAANGTTLETPVIDFNADITIGNSRSVVIADSENTSRMVQFTFATFAWGFTMVPAMYMNNEIDMQADFDRKFLSYLYKFADTLDVAAIAALAATKTQVIADPLNYAVSGQTINGAWKQRETILGDINPIMNANKYYGQMHILGNAGIQSLINQLAKKGLYNETNQQMEYSDKIVHFSTNLANAANKFGTGYAVASSMLGAMFRFEREALLGTKTKDGHEWGIETLPLMNIPVGTYFYESVGDFSGIGGASTADMTRARKEHYGFAVDVCLVTPYNSAPATNASPIIKFDIANEAVSDAIQVNVVNTAGNPVQMHSV